MDYARREYVTRCRFFKDSDVEVEIQWYRAAEDAPSLPFPTAFMSTEWLDSGYDEPQKSELGEVFDAPTPYSFHGAPVGLTYDHICGTEDEFENGVTYDPTRDVKYDEQGLPLCCRAPATPQMGVVVGADVELSSSVIVNGVDCLNATLLPVGELGDTGFVPAGTQVWAELVGHGTGNYRFTFNIPGGLSPAQVLQGVNCGGLSVYFTVHTSGDYDVPLVAGQRYWIIFSIFFFPGRSTLTVTPLP